jgi:hypothetical protein
VLWIDAGEDDGVPRARVCLHRMQREARTYVVMHAAPPSSSTYVRIFRPPVDGITMHVRAEFESGRTRRLALLLRTTLEMAMGTRSPIPRGEFLY